MRLALLGCLALAACASQPPMVAQPSPSAIRQAHVPHFARRPFEPFSRVNTVAIALREWRLFGEQIDDAPPGTHAERGEDKPERQPGLWQRVGEYWWLGQNATEASSAWTGKHDGAGTAFAPQFDEQYAWSAAFISYVMRIAGAGDRFPYSPAHATYINAAARTAQGTTEASIVTAERPDSYAPKPGDLLCYGRRAARTLRFEDLPASQFTSHCDLVIGPSSQGLIVIGGNVDDAVTMKHIPTSADGRIAAAGNTIFDRRYPWMVVIRVLYDTP